MPFLTLKERSLLEPFKNPTQEVLKDWEDYMLSLPELESARFKWLSIDWLLKEELVWKEDGDYDLFVAESKKKLVLKAGRKSCLLCENHRDKPLNGSCSGCPIEPIVGYHCQNVWGYWLDEGNPNPVLNAIIEASCQEETLKSFSREAVQPKLSAIKKIFGIEGKEPYLSCPWPFNIQFTSMEALTEFSEWATIQFGEAGKGNWLMPVWLLPNEKIIFAFRTEALREQASVWRKEAKELGKCL